MPGASGCPSGTSTGCCSCGEHWGAPTDLLAAALRVEPDRLPALTARWRRAGYAATGRLGPGPGWCWLTRDGMTATGLGFPATRPALGRLAHLRAILAARLWMQANPAWQQGQAWWHSERRLRAEQPAAGRKGHVPDAEIHWPSIEGSPYAGQVWAIEVELTPKPVARTTRIMTGLLAPMTLRAGDLPDRPDSPLGRHPRRGVAAARRAGPGGGPGPARLRVHPGAAPVTPWAWLKFTIFLWLLRKTLKLTGWLLLAAVVIAAWPVTAGRGRRVPGGVAARLAPGPAVPDRGLGAAGAAAAWLAAVEVRTPGWRPALAGTRPGLGARLGSPGRARAWAGRSCCWPRWRSRPGWRWAGCCGRGGSTPSPPGWAASPPRPRSSSTPASGTARPAPPWA